MLSRTIRPAPARVRVLSQHVSGRQRLQQAGMHTIRPRPRALPCPYSRVTLSRGGAGRSRFQSNYSGSASGTARSGGNPALVGGLAGGSIAFLLGYLWYNVSGAKQLVQASKKTQKYFEEAKRKVAQATPDIEPNEAMNWLRSTALKYAGLVPGASKYVNAIFDDLDRVRERHGEAFDKAARDAYHQLHDLIAKEGLTVQSAKQAAEILARFSARVGRLAGDAAEEILDNHPDLKDKVGDSLKQMKQLSDAYGPQIAKEFDDVWDQVSDIARSGASLESAEKIRKLVQEKTESLRKKMDQAWQEGLKQAKPYLDKNPAIKKLIDENQDALKSGDFSSLWDMIKQAADSGKVEDLEKFVLEKAQNAKGFSGLDQLLKMVPGGDQVGPKIEVLQKLAQKRGNEAEKIMRETVNDLQDVLKKRSDQAKKLVDQTEKEMA